MSLFNIFNRAVKGEPLYLNNSKQAATAPEQQPVPGSESLASTAEPAAPSTLPVVMISKTNVHSEGSDFRVDIFITNSSAESVDLKRLKLGEHESELEYALRPGQSMQSPLYAGPLLVDTKIEYVQIIYKSESGQYFTSSHDVHYTYDDHNNGYLISEVRLRPPVQPLNT